MIELDNGKMPLVSVIIPTYNRIATLPQSISSVLNQTYVNLELIVMDDGSVDGTEEYVKSIKDSRIKYMRSEINSGPSAARNRGTELARGEYLAFQDSDDEWMPDKLEKQMALMLGEEAVSLVYSEYGVYLGGKFVSYVPSREVPSEEKSGDIFARLLLHPLIGTPTMVVRTREFLEEGGFDESLKAYEDYEFTLRFARSHRIGFIGEMLLKVNSSLDSVNRRSDERIHSQFFMVREMLEPLRERGLLWRKLEIVLHEAETHRCQDIFIEELEYLSQALLSDSEGQSALRCLEKARKSREVFLQRVRIQENIPKLKGSLLEVYAELLESRALWSEEQQKSIQNIMDMMCECEAVFNISEAARNRRNQIQVKLEEGIPDWADQLYLLADIAEALEMLERDMAAFVD